MSVTLKRKTIYTGLVGLAGAGIGFTLAKLLAPSAPTAPASPRVARTYPGFPPPSAPLAPEPPRLPAPAAPAPQLGSGGSPVLLDGPPVSDVAARDIAGQQRNYKTGYFHGLFYRAGNTSIMALKGDEGFEPFHDQGVTDGWDARRPRFDDQELLAAWTKAVATPAVRERYIAPAERKEPTVQSDVIFSTSKQDGVS